MVRRVTANHPPVIVLPPANDAHLCHNNNSSLKPVHPFLREPASHLLLTTQRSKTPLLSLMFILMRPFCFVLLFTLLRAAVAPCQVRPVWPATVHCPCQASSSGS